MCVYVQYFFAYEPLLFISYPSLQSALNDAQKNEGSLWLFVAPTELVAKCRGIDLERNRSKESQYILKLLLVAGTPERGQRGANAPPAFHLGEKREQKCSF